MRNFKGGQLGSTPVVVDVSMLTFPIGITVVPGSGDTVKCEACTSPEGNTNPNSANWVAVTGLSAAAAAAQVSLAIPCYALRFSQSAGTGTDTYEVCS